MTQKKHVYVERSEHIIKLKTFAYSLKKVLCKDFVHVRWWSEMFSASTIDENTIGKIFFPQIGTSFISIHVKLQVILSSSLFYKAVWSRSVVCFP